MLKGINMAEVEQYNRTLKAYKDKSADLKAELSFIQKEIASACEELSRDLNMQVTPDNIEQVYNAQMEKMESTLKTGEAILNKIMEEESKIANGQGGTKQPEAQPNSNMYVPPMTAAHSQGIGGGASVDWRNTSPSGQATNPQGMSPQSKSDVPDDFMNEPVKTVTMPNKVSDSFFQAASVEDFMNMSKPFNM